MKCYGSVKGLIYRNVQPEPSLKCRSCGKKKPEHEFVDETNSMSSLCPTCRKKQCNKYERIIREDAERKGRFNR